jgi:hypothetical protein
MEATRGYIYVRSNSWWNSRDVYKLGRTTNISGRDSQYVSREFERGNFEAVYSIPDIHIGQLLQLTFKYLNVPTNGGIDFYQKCIIDLIEPFFKEHGIIYVKYTPKEIKILTRSRMLQKITNKINKKDLIRVLISESVVCLNDGFKSQLKTIGFGNSEIIKCRISDKQCVISDKTKYQAILTDIWLTMQPNIVKEKTTFKTSIVDEKGKRGYKWIVAINMSLQRKDANGTILEIVNMVILNKFMMDIAIKLDTGKTIHLIVS